MKSLCRRSILVGGGVPEISLHNKSYLFCVLKPHSKFQKPRTTPAGRKVTQVPPAMPEGSVTGYILVIKPKMKTEEKCPGIKITSLILNPRKHKTNLAN
jgi:hypothetical protein